MRVSEQAKLYNCTLDTEEVMWFVSELCGVMTTIQAKSTSSTLHLCFWQMLFAANEKI